jgi:hypothetical protein
MTPDPETLANRQAAQELIRAAARRGDPVCGALGALEAEARASGNGFEYVLGTAQDFRDEKEDEEL